MKKSAKVSDSSMGHIVDQANGDINFPGYFASQNMSGN